MWQAIAPWTAGTPKILHSIAFSFCCACGFQDIVPSQANAKRTDQDALGGAK